MKDIIEKLIINIFKKIGFKVTDVSIDSKIVEGYKKETFTKDGVYTEEDTYIKLTKMTIKGLLEEKEIEELNNNKKSLKKMKKYVVITIDNNNGVQLYEAIETILETENYIEKIYNCERLNWKGLEKKIKKDVIQLERLLEKS